MTDSKAMSNDDLADQLLAQAGEALERRKILLTVIVALSTTKTVPAARRALDNWHGPDDIKQAALTVLDELSQEK